MSLDQARAFIERMKSDETFCNRVSAIKDVALRFNLIKSEVSTPENSVPVNPEQFAAPEPE